MKSFIVSSLSLHDSFLPASSKVIHVLASKHDKDNLFRCPSFADTGELPKSISTRLLSRHDSSFCITWSYSVKDDEHPCFMGLDVVGFGTHCRCRSRYQQSPDFVLVRSRVRRQNHHFGTTTQWNPTTVVGTGGGSKSTAEHGARSGESCNVLPDIRTVPTVRSFLSQNVPFPFPATHVVEYSAPLHSQ